MSQRLSLAIVTFILVAGFVLRVHWLGAVPFRGDEAFAAQYWAGQPLSEALAHTATIEPHPPLTYAFFRLWGLTFGTGEFALRLLPALFNLMGIAALYALGCCLQGRHLGLLAALLWAIHPYQIWQAQDARNYAIWAGLSVVGVWLALRVIVRQRRIDWLLYIAVAVITAFTFYMELLTFAALTVFVVLAYRTERRFVRRWLAVHFVIVGAVLLTFWVLQGQLFASGGYGGTVVSFNALLWLTSFLPTLIFGTTLADGLVQLLWPMLLIILSIALIVIWHYDQRQALFLGVWGILPPLLLGIISLRLNVFNPRYVLSAAPAYLLIFGKLVFWLGENRPQHVLKRSVALLLVSAWVFVSIFGLRIYFNDYVKAENWPALTAYLRDHVQPDDLVIQTSVDAAFGYYYDAPARDIGLPENPEQPRDEVIATLAQSSSAYRSIWVVGRTFADWPNAGIVERWMQDNMQRVRATSTAGLPIQQFMRWQLGKDEIGPLPLAIFEGVAELADAHIATLPEPTNDLPVWVYWRPLATTNDALKVFVHLIGPINPSTGTPIWAQDDHFPQNGRVSTDTWDILTTYRDVYNLPLAAVPPGDYAIEIGLYDPTTNQRIPVAEADSYTIGQITLP